MGISGLILAGGLARRLGGVNKALIPLMDRPMISHVIERLSPQVNSLSISVHEQSSLLENFDLPQVTDLMPGHLGPLAGLHAGLSFATENWVLTCPCDTPILPLDLASRLLEQAQNQQVPIAIATENGHRHPVFCLCHQSMRQSLEDFIRSGGRKMDAWQTAQPHTEVDFSDQAFAFANINTPHDLSEVEHTILKMRLL
jgi:molybdenum cofactor guanylyltransferase